MIKTSITKIGLMIFALSFSNSLISQSNPSQLVKNWVTANEKQTESTLPNFSYAGYHNSEVGLPSSFSQTIYDVTDPLYGAVADDTNSDKAAIIAAIAAAEQNPNGGIVFFPPGKFIVNDGTVDNLTEIIRISKSNIVIKGSGSGTGGTELYQKDNTTHPDMATKDWTCPYLFYFWNGEDSANNFISNVVANADRGGYSIEIADASNISVGQWVELYVKNTSTALLNEELYPYTTANLYKPADLKIVKNGVEVREIHKVVSKTGNIITFKEPLHRAVNYTYGWKINNFSALEEVGIQDLKYTGGFIWEHLHHQAPQEIYPGEAKSGPNAYLGSSGWSGIQFNHVVNGWVSNVEFSNMSQAAQFKFSAYCSVLNNRYTGNPGHNFMTTNSATGCLLGKNIDTTTGTWHGSGVNALSIGNVLWRNEHPQNGNSGMENHASQPRSNLYDVCKGGFFFNQGGSTGALPNHLKNLVLWNFEGVSYQSSSVKSWRPNSETIYAKFLMPIISGLQGFTMSTEENQYQENESPGSHVDETSLYETQLTHRLGSLPDWIESSLRTETFENTTISGWSTETYTGENGINWTLNAKSTSGYIGSSKNIYMQAGKTGATSGTIKGGISSFTVTCKDLWDADVDRNLELLVNGAVVGTKTHNGSEVYTFEVNNINIEGDITIAIRNASPTGTNKSVAIDNLTWTSYTPFHPASLEVSSSNMAIQIGNTSTITETVYPSYAGDKSVSWSSSDTSIATVNSNGLITGITTGVAIVTATTTDGGLTATCEVSVGATETFENTTTTGWSNETYTGDNGFIWTLDAKSTSGYIDSTKDIYMRSGKTGVLSGSIPGGISSITVSCKDLWEPETERTLQLIINGSIVDTFNHTGTEIYTYNVDDIDISGTFTLAIKNASPTDTNKSIAIDNISWTPYSTTNANKSGLKSDLAGIETNAERLSKTSVYPNPFKNNLTIILEKGVAEILLMSIHGKLICRKTVNNQSQVHLNFTNNELPNGIYILQTIGKNKQRTYKLLHN